MYRDEEIEIVIDEDGNATVNYICGVQGKGCVDATKWIEEGLGGVVERKTKPEFHRKAKVQEKRKIGRKR